MKRIWPFLLAFTIWMPVCFGNLSKYEETADGYLSTGEYAFSPWLEGEEKLIVDGGDATTIDTWDSSQLEVYSTSLPLSYTGNRGVYDISLNDDSSLLFTGGATQSIKLYFDATAELRGGQINYIATYRRPVDLCQVTIYAQEGYQWHLTGGKKTAISGLWENGTEFWINITNVDPFPPTANFITVVEVMPEPATLALLGLGGFVLRRKR